jgi:hypothetical protein
MARRWRLKNLSVDRVDIVDNPANPLADMALIYKRDELTASDVTVTDTQDPEVSVDEVTETPEVDAETVEAPEAQAELLEDETTPVADEIEAAPELVAASADPVEDIEKADLRKSLADAQAEIAKMKSDAKRAEYIAKAKTDLDNLGDATELGGLLLDAADNLSEASYQTLERTLKAANAQIGSGDLFRQVGDPGAEPAAAGDKITALAQKMVDNGEAANLGLAKMAVVKTHPELRDEYYSAAERA